MLRLPIVVDRFRNAVILPWQPQPAPPPSPQLSPWPLVGMFGMGLVVGTALGGWLGMFGPTRERLQQMSEGVATRASNVSIPIRGRASVAPGEVLESEVPPVVVPPGPVAPETPPTSADLSGPPRPDLAPPP